MMTVTSDNVKILIADDHKIVREGLRALLNYEPDFQVVGEASDGQEAVRLASQLYPDLILMDLVMPVMDGIEAIRKISSLVPETGILVLTSFVEDEQIFQAIKAGAQGYLLKDSSTEELCEAIRCVKRGQSSIDPRVARKLILQLHSGKKVNARNELITSREMNVIQLLAQGKTNKQIGGELFLTEATVRFHVSNILRKLSLENRAQIILYAIRERILT